MTHKKNVAFILCPPVKPKSPTGSDIYRSFMPSHYLSQNGWNASSLYFTDLYTRRLAEGPKFWVDLIDGHDIFVFPRLTIAENGWENGFHVLFKMLKGLGKKIVYESDDDYSNKYRQVHSGDVESPIGFSDAITVTTPFLAEKMRQYTDKPIYVLPNSISPETLVSGQNPRTNGGKNMYPGKLIIALTGSPTHYEDWKVLESVIPRIVKENPNVLFILGGFHPPYFDGSNPQYLLVDNMNYEDYCKMIRICDIVLCPVIPEDGFNLGKSPIKAIEAQAARRTLEGGFLGGAAVIATDNPVYRMAIKSGENGILVEHTPESWYNALYSMINSPVIRSKIQHLGHKSALKNYNIVTNWRLWANAYKKILAT